MRTLLHSDWLRIDTQARLRVNVLPVPNGPITSIGGVGLGSRIMAIASCWFVFGFLSINQSGKDFYRMGSKT